MGNDNQKRESQPIKNDGVGIINHQKFKNFNLLQKEGLIEITINIDTERDFKNWEENLKKVKRFDDQQSLLTPSNYQYIPKGICSSHGIVKIYFQNYPYLFEEEIQNRLETNKYFQEEELWYLLYCLVSAARDFDRIKSKIGDVRPANIFINEQGQLKIAHLFSWPYEITNFQKTVYDRKLTYLSPEQMQIVQEKTNANITNKILSESFSIGLTMLQSGLLFDVSQFYSVDHSKIDFDKLNKKLEEWLKLQFWDQVAGKKKSYSQLLKKVVVSLCHRNFQERISSLKVWEMLRPFQDQISNLEPFDKNAIKIFGPLSPSNNHSPPTPIIQQVHHPQQRIVYMQPAQSIPFNPAPHQVYHQAPSNNSILIESPRKLKTQQPILRHTPSSVPKQQKIVQQVQQMPKYQQPVINFQRHKSTELRPMSFNPSTFTEPTRPNQVPNHNSFNPYPYEAKPQQFATAPSPIIQSYVPIHRDHPSMNASPQKTANNIPKMVQFGPSIPNYGQPVQTIKPNSRPGDSFPIPRGQQFIKEIDKQLQKSRRQFPNLPN